MIDEIEKFVVALLDVFVGTLVVHRLTRKKRSPEPIEEPPPVTP